MLTTKIRAKSKIKDLRESTRRRSMTQTHFTWPITPRRLQAASRLLRNLRERGCRFLLDKDRRGLRVRSPSDMPVEDYNVEFDDDVFELRDELIELLKREQRDLAMKP